MSAMLVPRPSRLLAVLEIVFTGLLVLTAVTIGLFAVLAAYKLFKGQAGH
jgi:hypothetical protein